MDELTLANTKFWAILNGARFAIYRLRELELAQFDLTIEQSSILFILKDHGGSTNIQELIDETMRQPNSVYTLINRMSKMGLVSKIERSDEKRVIIAITQQGETLLKSPTTISLDMVFSCLSVQEQIQMAGLLNPLIDKARELLGTPFKFPFIRYKQAGKAIREWKLDENLPSTKLWAILNCAGFAIYRLRELELARFDLTIEQSSVLYLLKDHQGSAAIRDLIEESMRQPNSVYTQINRMSKMGLVSKVEKSDEKRVMIAITKQGENVLKKATAVSLEMAFCDLPVKDKVKLADLLNRLIEKARDMLGMHNKIPFLKHPDSHN